MDKEIKEILIAEMKRLYRMNDWLEKNMKNEPELIIQNVSAMCEIAKLFSLNVF